MVKPIAEAERAKQEDLAAAKLWYGEFFGFGVIKTMTSSVPSDTI